MLSSIHPFGERSRNNRFWITAVAHVLGSAVGGVVLGAIAGSAGLLVDTVVDIDSASRAVIVAAVALVGAGLELTGRERSFPTRTRQVNENWLHQYRGWVYGGGFGFELGFGVSTIITTTLVHVMVLTMVLAGSFAAAMSIGAVFGVVRGATVLASFRVDSVEGLRTLHRRLESARSSARLVAVAALVLAGLVGLSPVLA